MLKGEVHDGDTVLVDSAKETGDLSFEVEPRTVAV
jgi:hypothetical protein